MNTKGTLQIGTSVGAGLLAYLFGAADALLAVLLAVVEVGNIIDNARGAGGVLRGLVMGFCIANEALSLTESAVRCGVPLP